MIRRVVVLCRLAVGAADVWWTVGITVTTCRSSVPTGSWCCGRVVDCGSHLDDVSWFCPTDSWCCGCVVVCGSHRDDVS